MISARNLDLIDRLIWTLIYGGLILVALALATGGASVLASWSMAVPGGVAIIVGIVLVAIRPSLTTPEGGAQSSDPSDQGTP